MKKLLILFLLTLSLSANAQNKKKLFFLLQAGSSTPTDPTISTFVINDANKDRIYFSSSEVITASTVSGFTVATPTKTISSVTINAGQTTGHYFTVSVAFSYGETPTLAYSGSGSNLQDLVGNALASFSATSITNNIAPFNPYTDITWVAAFDPTDYNGGAGTWNNQGTGADAAQGGATIYPSKLSSLSTKSTYGLSFVNASGTGLQYASGTVSEPFETWVEIITASSFGGTYRIYANGSATRLTINSSGLLSVSGTSDVSTGITLSASTKYVLRIVNNGASSSVTVNNGTPATFTITAQNGSSSPKLGHAYTSPYTHHWTGTMGAFFQKSTALSGGEVTSMWTWFGL